jgi:hypothetical protein
MKRSIQVAGSVTLATFIVCYAGIRQELRIAKQAPSSPVRLAEQAATLPPAAAAGSP